MRYPIFNRVLLALFALVILRAEKCGSGPPPEGAADASVPRADAAVPRDEDCADEKLSEMTDDVSSLKPYADIDGATVSFVPSGQPRLTFDVTVTRDLSGRPTRLADDASPVTFTLTFIYDREGRLTRADFDDFSGAYNTAGQRGEIWRFDVEDETIADSSRNRIVYELGQVDQNDCGQPTTGWRGRGAGDTITFTYDD